jgi:hypothetical protein
MNSPRGQNTGMANQWMFPESRDASVSTTKSVLENGPIVSVHHEPDGRWTFLGVGRAAKEEPVSLKLGDFVDRFPWVSEFADLPTGATASRDHVMAPWHRD